MFDLRIDDFIHNEHGPIDAGITSVACEWACRSSIVPLVKSFCHSSSACCAVNLCCTQMRCGRRAPCHRAVTNVLAVSPDGKLVAAGSLDTMVRVWNVQTGQQVERLKGHKDSVYR